jgi:hypothetical protein
MLKATGISCRFSSYLDVFPRRLKISRLGKMPLIADLRGEPVEICACCRREEW